MRRRPRRHMLADFVARFLQERASAVRIVWVGGQIGVVTEAGGQEGGRQPLGVALVDVGEDAVPVDGVVKRLTDAHIVERFGGVVQLDAVCPGAGSRVHREPWYSVDA